MRIVIKRSNTNTPSVSTMVIFQIRIPLIQVHVDSYIPGIKTSKATAR